MIDDDKFDFFPAEYPYEGPNMTEQKPREFWIDGFDGTSAGYISDKPLDRFDYHLIEYSAVETVQSELAVCKASRNQESEALESARAEIERLTKRESSIAATAIQRAKDEGHWISKSIELTTLARELYTAVQKYFSDGPVEKWKGPWEQVENALAKAAEVLGDKDE